MSSAWRRLQRGARGTSRARLPQSTARHCLRNEYRREQLHQSHHDNSTHLAEVKWLSVVLAQGESQLFDVAHQPARLE